MIDRQKHGYTRYIKCYLAAICDTYVQKVESTIWLQGPSSDCAYKCLYLTPVILPAQLQHLFEPLSLISETDCT